MLDVDEESLRPGLVPCVNLVDAPYPPGWDTCSIQTRDDVSHGE